MYLQPEDEREPNRSTLGLVDRNKPINEMYSELMNEELKAQYDKMQAQLEEYEQKREESHNRWMLVVWICAAIAAMPTFYMLVQWLRGKLDLKTAKDVLYVFGVCIGMGVVLFAIHLTAFYLMFYAERSVQTMALALVLFGGGATLWIATLRASKKHGNKKWADEE